MIVKINIVKAATILAETSIQNYYLHENKDKTTKEIEEMIYVLDKKVNEDGTEVRTRLHLQPKVQKEFDNLYKSYFQTLLSCKEKE